MTPISDQGKTNLQLVGAASSFLVVVAVYFLSIDRRKSGVHGAIKVPEYDDDGDTPALAAEMT